MGRKKNNQGGKRTYIKGKFPYLKVCLNRQFNGSTYNGPNKQGLVEATTAESHFLMTKSRCRYKTRPETLQLINEGQHRPISEQTLQRELHSLNIWSRAARATPLLTLANKTTWPQWTSTLPSLDYRSLKSQISSRLCSRCFANLQVGHSSSGSVSIIVKFAFWMKCQLCSFNFKLTESL